MGVLFDLEKGWHIYWVNPGDSGEPPKIKWQLPAGFEAKEIRWPTPVRLGGGTVIDYGYEGRVLLPVSIRVPASYASAKPVMLSADIRYLICREVRAYRRRPQASLSIPSSNAGDAAAIANFSAARSIARQKQRPAGWKAQANDNARLFLAFAGHGYKREQGHASLSRWTRTRSITPPHRAC